jgi:hypothetical protein
MEPTMRLPMMLLMTGAVALLATLANAADDKLIIAVFTKNLTNPAYEAFRIASDQIARSSDVKVVHYVPKQPDNVDEQKAMVEQVLKDKPDAVIFIPVDDVAMVDHINDTAPGPAIASGFLEQKPWILSISQMQTRIEFVRKTHVMERRCQGYPRHAWQYPSAWRQPGVHRIPQASRRRLSGQHRDQADPR